MDDPKPGRLCRSLASLHRTGLLLPTAGLVVMGGSAWAMAAAAAVWPEVARAPGDMGQCSVIDGDFGCGHGFGCACHLLPPPDPHI